MEKNTKKRWRKTFSPTSNKVENKPSGFNFIGITPHRDLSNYEVREILNGGILCYTRKKSDVPFFYIAPKRKMSPWQKTQWIEELKYQKKCELSGEPISINPKGSGVACIMVGVKPTKSLHWRVKRLSFEEEDIIGEDLARIADICQKYKIKEGRGFSTIGHNPNSGFWEIIGLPWDDGLLDDPPTSGDFD